MTVQRMVQGVLGSVSVSRLGWLLLTSALASAPLAAQAQEIVWDTGDPTTPDVENVDGDWNLDDGNRPWQGSSGETPFENGNDVVFVQIPDLDAVAVRVTEDVRPGSITFEAVDGESTVFTIGTDGSGGEIVASTDLSSPTDIFMETAATINAGLAGVFDVEGTGTLTLGGTSASLVELNVQGPQTLVVATGANVGGTIDMNNGSLVINGTTDNVVTDFDATATVNVGGSIDGQLVNLGTATVDGSVGNVINGTFGDIDLNATGSIAGAFSNRGDATIAGSVGSLENRASGDVVFDGTMTVGAGGFENMGTAQILTGVTVTAETTLTDGTLTVNGGGVLTGTVDIAGNGAIVVGGRVNGTVTNDGSVEVAATGTIAGNVNNEAGSSLESDGAITGTLTNDGTATLAGTVGALVNTETTTVDGTLLVAGAVTNSGDLTVDGAAMTAAGGITNQSGGIIDVLAGSSITGSIFNASGAEVQLSGGAALLGGLTNAGRLQVDGSASVAGLNSSGTIDMSNGGAGDVLSLSGGATLNGRIELDVDLSGTTGGADLISIASTVTGSAVLAFTNIGAGFGPLTTPLTVMTFGSGSSLNLTAEGLVGVGSLVYGLNVTETAAQVVTFANPNVGAISGSVTLTQSLIGSVINRPSSPFVTGQSGKQECRPGVWARAVGGKADATGATFSVDNAGEVVPYDSRVSASYSGLQVGGDIACPQWSFAGWDMTLGGILGVNGGSTLQPVFAVTSGATLPGIVLSENSTDFRQIYGGVYMSAVKDRFLVDLQYRLEKTNYDLTNNGVGAERIGILDQEFDSSGATLSGSVSYVVPLNKEQGINLVPTAGFAFTRFSTESLELEDGRLDIDDGSTEVAFLGATLSKTKILPSGKAALTYFVTGTAYKDFADPLRSVYIDDTSEIGLEIFSSNLGVYGEASIGVNYTQLLEPGNAILNAQQLNASVRLDSRFGEALDSWGVTAQMRLQF